MTTRKTIGGDRLGSGKKMKVDLKSYERSTHNLSKKWRSTMASGTLVPFLHEVGLPGDTFDIELEVDGKTHPTVGPLFGSFKMQIDVFMCPIRLYQGLMHNNALDIGNNMDRVKLPQIRMTAPEPVFDRNLDNQQINPSSIFKYIGISGLGRLGTAGQTVRRDFNGVPFIAYWDIYKNYYANKQEEIGAVIHNDVDYNIPRTITDVMYVNANGGGGEIPQNGTTLQAIVYNNGTIQIQYEGEPPSYDDIMLLGGQNERISLNVACETIGLSELNGLTAITGTNFRMHAHPILGWKLTGWAYRNERDGIDTEPKIKTFPLKNIDEMRNNLLLAINQTTPYIIDETSIAPYGLPLQVNNVDGRYSKMASQEGLAIKTYQSDLFNNWMSTEWIDGDNGINAITAIDVSDGLLKIDTLQLAKKVYDMLNRIAISGGTLDDWQEAVYGEKRMGLISTPVYMGGLIREMGFQEVISNGESTESQPLGTLAGKGVMTDSQKGGTVTVKVNEPCYIMGIVSLTPRIDYSQGNKWDVNLKTMNDFHKPALDEIGFQDLSTDQMAWWDSTVIWENGVPITQFKSAGKQPAWMNYMTNVNEVRGNFAVEDNEMFMTLNRRYESDEFGDIMDLTTYIDPVKFNHIFAETARDAQNFWVQIDANITARRKMSAKIMPNL